ncbi:MAG TPA: xanthine dehydrogenase family protein subunit M [Pirellulales bacterium]|jgi:xanthine dehydrogenase YagS FAD-binding subunit|nr:xanthine dehydrogenase family protein subunit M [Pirellulales bacterium]
MNGFSYVRAEDVTTAVRRIAEKSGAKAVAGGTNLIDLIKCDVERPQRLVDINHMNHMPCGSITVCDGGGLRLGALATNAEVARDEQVRARYPLLSEAILAGASPQIRNMATVGGNLLQRTRCPYFYDTATPCNKRTPETGCSALDGFNRNHAILGASEHCIATHPSDMCVALAALEAEVCVSGPVADRTIAFGDFHRLPEDLPHLDSNLESDEIITAVELPAKGFAEHYAYLKVRERTSFAFALVSVAVGLEMQGDAIAEARLALGGVAHKPWRNRRAETLLEGRQASRENFQQAAEAMLYGAQGYGQNDFKIPLAKRAIVRALTQAAAGVQRQ